MILSAVEALFFGLQIISSAVGFLDLVLLLILKKHPRYRGVATLLVPFIPLTLITFLELYSYFLYYRYPGRLFPALLLLFEWCRIMIAFGWNYLAYCHYALNEVDIMRWGRVGFFALLSGLLVLAVPVALFYAPVYMPAVHTIVIAMFYFAGIKGVLITRKTETLLPSSKTAVHIAAMSLVFYPAVAIGDLLGWRFSFLDPSMSLWVQSHPLYVFLVNIPVVIFMLSHYPVPVAEEGTHVSFVPFEVVDALLSGREQEVLRLLYEGYRYTEIADKLFLSLATVKTHVHHIYRKLGISRREELFLKLRGEPAAEPADAQR